MRTVLRLFLLGYIGALAIASVCAQEENLVPNPGYEAWGEAGPEAWDAEGLALEAETGDVHSGQSALRVAIVENAGRFSAMFYTAGKIALKPDTLYLASVWAKCVSDAPVAPEIRICMQQYGEPGYMAGRSMIHTEVTDDWTLYQFFYGNVEDVREIRFDLNVRNRDAVVLFDDVVFRELGPTDEPGATLIPNGSMEADGDGDGVPDGWTVSRPLREADRALAVGPDGTRALMARCAPEPNQPTDLTTWYDWSAQPPPAAGWVNAGGTPTFAVEAGRTYLIRFRTRGQGVRTFHTKWWWMADESTSTEWFVIGPRHDGDWDWEQVNMYLTVPSAHIGAARVEFWARAAGGRIWVDDVTVQPSRGYTAGWTADTHEVAMVEDAILPPESAAGDIPPRTAAPASPAERDETTVTVADDAIRIAFSTGIDITLAIDGGNLLGITDVRVGDLPLRNSAAPPIAPLIETESGGHYVSCRYVSHDVGSEGEVILRSLLKAADGHEDRLSWMLRPRVDDVAGRRYAGFAYGFDVRTRSEAIIAIADRATWEIGGNPLGVIVVTQNGYSVDNVFAVAPDNVYIGTGGQRFAGGDGFDYQYAPEGALGVFYAEPISFVDNRRSGSEEYLSFRDTTMLPGDADARTPLKCVLYTDYGDHDEWTRLRDYVYDTAAAARGITQHTPMPAAQCWMNWRELAKQGDQVLYHIADEVAPKLGALGFKVLVLHSVWGRGGCSLDFIEPGEDFGGPKALKYLCDKAAENGMIVQAWAPTAHMWQYSPLFEKFPSWWLEGVDGKPPTGYCFPSIRGTRFQGGWHDYAVAQWTKIREETGLGSLWLDSYNNFTHGIRLADRRIAMEQAADLFDFHAALSQAGYVLYVESTGTFGITAPGFPVANVDSPAASGPDPMTRYGLSNYIGHELDEKRNQVVNDVITGGDYYYRSLANKAPAWVVWLPFEQTPERHEKVGQANRDYTAVVDLMTWRHTLPDDNGVWWDGPDGADDVLFAYRQFRHQVDGLISAIDVTSGEDVPVTENAFMAEAMHTYRVKLAR